MPLAQFVSLFVALVVRVEPGGKSYRVLVVDDTTESYTVKAVEGPYPSR